MEADVSDQVSRNPAKGETGRSAPGFGTILGFWVLAMVLLQVGAWLSGVRGYGLAVAVERGAARVEGGIIGEVPDDVIRKAIQTQQDSLIFWATLTALGDFVVEPASLVLRAILAATLFAGFAALGGRPIRFEHGLAACAWAQGFWVLGLAVRVALMILLRQPDVETSATLFLPAGTYPATTWVALRQLDVFALLGWTTMASGGWRRGQANLVGSLLICMVLWGTEAILRMSIALILGAGMRMTLIAG